MVTLKEFCQIKNDPEICDASRRKGNMKIFLSYCHRIDLLNVDILENILKEEFGNLNVFRDIHYIEPGDDQKRLVKEKIWDADCVVTLISIDPKTNTISPWVVREIYEAHMVEQIKQKKLIFPILVGMNYNEIKQFDVLSKFLRYDPFLMIFDKDYDLLLAKIKEFHFSKKPTLQNYSILPIVEDGLEIYRVSDLVNFEKNQFLKYVQTVDAYYLCGFNKGNFFKYFALCDNQKDTICCIKDMLNQYSFLYVTGDGDKSYPNKWRVWFIDTRFQTNDEPDLRKNNIEDEDYFFLPKECIKKIIPKKNHQ